MLWSTIFACYALFLRNILNLWSVLNLWNAFPIKYLEYNFCVMCNNFLNLGDKGLK